jgi:putative endonuclease
MGYKILYRNFRVGNEGELDIVARHRDVLVFVEVKSRRSMDAGRPAEAVDRKKRMRLIYAGKAWLRMLKDNTRIAYRWDVVEVVWSDVGNHRVEVIENAFLPDPW